MPDIGRVDLKHEILENLLAVHTNSIYPDVFLVVEGTRLEAHRIILAAQSKVLRSMLLDEGFVESTQLEVPIKASPSAMKMLLSFVYSGELNLREFVLSDVVDLLELAHRFEFESLEKMVANYLVLVVDAQNAVAVLEVANLLGQQRLMEQCFTLVEMIIEGIYEVDLEIPFRSMVGLMDRKPRKVSEVKLFQALHRMASKNGLYTTEEKAILLSRIDLTKMTASQIFQIVAPTKLINSSDITTLMTQNSFMYTVIPLNELQMPVKKIATLVKGYDPQYAFQQKKDLFCSHQITDFEADSIIIDLNSVYIINCIKFVIAFGNNRYIIQHSRDNENWEELVNMSTGSCDFNQELYFSDTIARYIQFLGFESTTGSIKLNSVSISYVVDPPKFLGWYKIPEANIATLDTAIANYSNSAGILQFDRQLLDGMKEDRGEETPYTAQKIGYGPLIIFLNQPYILSSCRFRLWDYDGRKYSYRVEVTADYQIYDVISDKTEELVEGWQRIEFSPRIVSRFLIYPIIATKGGELRIVHFEAPAQE